MNKLQALLMIFLIALSPIEVSLAYAQEGTTSDPAVQGTTDGGIVDTDGGGCDDDTEDSVGTNDFDPSDDQLCLEMSGQSGTSGTTEPSTTTTSPGTIYATGQLDSDLDGYSNVLESLRYSTNPSDPSSSPSSFGIPPEGSIDLDLDSDGFSNQLESTMNTDALDGGSYPSAVGGDMAYSISTTGTTDTGTTKPGETYEPPLEPEPAADIELLPSIPSAEDLDFTIRYHFSNPVAGSSVSKNNFRIWADGSYLPFDYKYVNDNLVEIKIARSYFDRNDLEISANDIYAKDGSPLGKISIFEEVQNDLVADSAIMAGSTFTLNLDTKGINIKKLKVWTQEGFDVSQEGYFGVSAFDNGINLNVLEAISQPLLVNIEFTDLTGDLFSPFFTIDPFTNSISEISFNLANSMGYDIGYGYDSGTVDPPPPPVSKGDACSPECGGDKTCAEIYADDDAGTDESALFCSSDCWCQSPTPEILCETPCPKEGDVGPPSPPPPTSPPPNPGRPEGQKGKLGFSPPKTGSNALQEIQKSGDINMLTTSGLGQLSLTNSELEAKLRGGSGFLKSFAGNPDGFRSFAARVQPYGSARALPIALRTEPFIDQVMVAGNAEYVQIQNPPGNKPLLLNSKYKYGISSRNPEGNEPTFLGDFDALFPEILIGPGKVVVVSITGSQKYQKENGYRPTLELFEDGDTEDNIPNMIPARRGSIDTVFPHLSNKDAKIYLYKKDSDGKITVIDTFELKEPIYEFGADYDDLDLSEISLEGSDEIVGTVEYLTEENKLISAEDYQTGKPYLAGVGYIEGDYDSDGIYDILESKLGTDYSNKDTDGDGFTDYQEVYLLGSSPLDSGTGSSETQGTLTSSEPDFNIELTAENIAAEPELTAPEDTPISGQQERSPAGEVDEQSRSIQQDADSLIAENYNSVDNRIVEEASLPVIIGRANSELAPEYIRTSYDLDPVSPATILASDANKQKTGIENLEVYSLESQNRLSGLPQQDDTHIEDIMALSRLLAPSFSSKTQESYNLERTREEANDLSSCMIGSKRKFESHFNIMSKDGKDVSGILSAHTTSGLIKVESSVEDLIQKISATTSGSPAAKIINILVSNENSFNEMNTLAKHSGSSQSFAGHPSLAKQSVFNNRNNCEFMHQMQSNLHLTFTEMINLNSAGPKDLSILKDLASGANSFFGKTDFTFYLPSQEKKGNTEFSAVINAKEDVALDSMASSGEKKTDLFIDSLKTPGFGASQGTYENYVAEAAFAANKERSLTPQGGLSLFTGSFVAGASDACVAQSDLQHTLNQIDSASNEKNLNDKFMIVVVAAYNTDYVFYETDPNTGEIVRDSDGNPIIKGEREIENNDLKEILEGDFFLLNPNSGDPAYDQWYMDYYGNLLLEIVSSIKDYGGELGLATIQDQIKKEKEISQNIDNINTNVKSKENDLTKAATNYQQADSALKASQQAISNYERDIESFEKYSAEKQEKIQKYEQILSYLESGNEDAAKELFKKIYPPSTRPGFDFSIMKSYVEGSLAVDKEYIAEAQETIKDLETQISQQKAGLEQLQKDVQTNKAALDQAQKELTDLNTKLAEEKSKLSALGINPDKIDTIAEQVAALNMLYSYYKNLNPSLSNENDKKKIAEKMGINPEKIDYLFGENDIYGKYVLIIPEVLQDVSNALDAYEYTATAQDIVYNQLGTISGELSLAMVDMIDTISQLEASGASQDEIDRHYAQLKDMVDQYKAYEQYSNRHDYRSQFQTTAADYGFKQGDQYFDSEGNYNGPEGKSDVRVANDQYRDDKAEAQSKISALNSVPEDQRDDNWKKEMEFAQTELKWAEDNLAKPDSEKAKDGKVLKDQAKEKYKAQKEAVKKAFSSEVKKEAKEAKDRYKNSKTSAKNAMGKLIKRGIQNGLIDKDADRNLLEKIKDLIDSGDIEGAFKLLDEHVQKRMEEEAKNKWLQQKAAANAGKGPPLQGYMTSQYKPCETCTIDVDVDGDGKKGEKADTDGNGENDNDTNGDGKVDGNDKDETVPVYPDMLKSNQGSSGATPATGSAILSLIKPNKENKKTSKTSGTGSLQIITGDFAAFDSPIADTGAPAQTTEFSVSSTCGSGGGLIGGSSLLFGANYFGLDVGGFPNIDQYLEDSSTGEAEELEKQSTGKLDRQESKIRNHLKDGTTKIGNVAREMELAGSKFYQDANIIKTNQQTTIEDESGNKKTVIMKDGKLYTVELNEIDINDEAALKLKEVKDNLVLQQQEVIKKLEEAKAELLTTGIIIDEKTLELTKNGKPIDVVEIKGNNLILNFPGVYDENKFTKKEKDLINDVYDRILRKAKLQRLIRSFVVNIASIIPQFETVDNVGLVQIHSNGKETLVSSENLVFDEGDEEGKTALGYDLVLFSPEGMSEDEYNAILKDITEAYNEGNLKVVEDLYKDLGIEWKSGGFIVMENSQPVKLVYNPDLGIWIKEIDNEKIAQAVQLVKNRNQNIDEQEWRRLVKETLRDLGVRIYKELTADEIDTFNKINEQEQSSKHDYLVLNTAANAIELKKQINGYAEKINAGLDINGEAKVNLREALQLYGKYMMTVAINLEKYKNYLKSGDPFLVARAKKMIPAILPLFNEGLSDSGKVGLPSEDDMKESMKLAVKIIADLYKEAGYAIGGYDENNLETYQRVLQEIYNGDALDLGDAVMRTNIAHAMISLFESAGDSANVIEKTRELIQYVQDEIETLKQKIDSGEIKDEESVLAIRSSIAMLRELYERLITAKGLDSEDLVVFGGGSQEEQLIKQIAELYGRLVKVGDQLDIKENTSKYGIEFRIEASANLLSLFDFGRVYNRGSAETLHDQFKQQSLALLKDALDKAGNDKKREIARWIYEELYLKAGIIEGSDMEAILVSLEESGNVDVFIQAALVDVLRTRHGEYYNDKIQETIGNFIQGGGSSEAAARYFAYIREHLERADNPTLANTYLVAAADEVIKNNAIVDTKALGVVVRKLTEAGFADKAKELLSKVILYNLAKRKNNGDLINEGITGVLNRANILQEQLAAILVKDELNSEDKQKIAELETELKKLSESPAVLLGNLKIVIASDPGSAFLRVSGALLLFYSPYSSLKEKEEALMDLKGYIKGVSQYEKFIDDKLELVRFLMQYEAEYNSFIKDLTLAQKSLLEFKNAKIASENYEDKRAVSENLIASAKQKLESLRNKAGSGSPSLQNELNQMLLRLAETEVAFKSLDMATRESLINVEKAIKEYSENVKTIQEAYKDKGEFTLLIGLKKASALRDAKIRLAAIESEVSKLNSRMSELISLGKQSGDEMQSLVVLLNKRSVDMEGLWKTISSLERDIEEIKQGKLLLDESALSSLETLRNLIQNERDIAKAIIRGSLTDWQLKRVTRGVQEGVFNDKQIQEVAYLLDDSDKEGWNGFFSYAFRTLSVWNIFKAEVQESVNNDPVLMRIVNKLEAIEDTFDQRMRIINYLEDKIREKISANPDYNYSDVLSLIRDSTSQDLKPYGIDSLEFSKFMDETNELFGPILRAHERIIKKIIALRKQNPSDINIKINEVYLEEYYKLAVYFSNEVSRLIDIDKLIQKETSRMFGQIYAMLVITMSGGADTPHGSLIQELTNLDPAFLKQVEEMVTTYVNPENIVQLIDSLLESITNPAMLLGIKSLQIGSKAIASGLGGISSSQLPTFIRLFNALAGEQTIMSSSWRKWVYVEGGWPGASGLFTSSINREAALLMLRQSGRSMLSLVANLYTKEIAEEILGAVITPLFGPQLSDLISEILIPGGVGSSLSLVKIKVSSLTQERINQLRITYQQKRDAAVTQEQRNAVDIALKSIAELETRVNKQKAYDETLVVYNNIISNIESSSASQIELAKNNLDVAERELAQASEVSQRYLLQYINSAIESGSWNNLESGIAPDLAKASAEVRKLGSEADQLNVKAAELESKLQAAFEQTKGALTPEIKALRSLANSARIAQLQITIRYLEASIELLSTSSQGAGLISELKIQLEKTRQAEAALRILAPHSEIMDRFGHLIKLKVLAGDINKELSQEGLTSEKEAELKQQLEKIKSEMQALNMEVYGSINVLRFNINTIAAKLQADKAKGIEINEAYLAALISLSYNLNQQIKEYEALADELGIPIGDAYLAALSGQKFSKEQAEFVSSTLKDTLSKVANNEITEKQGEKIIKPLLRHVGSIFRSPYAYLAALTVLLADENGMQIAAGMAGFGGLTGWLSQALMKISNTAVNIEVEYKTSGDIVIEFKKPDVIEEEIPTAQPITLNPELTARINYLESLIAELNTGNIDDIGTEIAVILEYLKATYEDSVSTNAINNVQNELFNRLVLLNPSINVDITTLADLVNSGNYDSALTKLKEIKDKYEGYDPILYLFRELEIDIYEGVGQDKLSIILQDTFNLVSSYIGQENPDFINALAEIKELRYIFGNNQDIILQILKKEEEIALRFGGYIQSIINNNDLLSALRTITEIREFGYISIPVENTIASMENSLYEGIDSAIPELKDQLSWAVDLITQGDLSSALTIIDTLETSYEGNELALERIHSIRLMVFKEIDSKYSDGLFSGIVYEISNFIKTGELKNAIIMINWLRRNYMDDSLLSVRIEGLEEDLYQKIDSTYTDLKDEIDGITNAIKNIGPSSAISEYSIVSSAIESLKLSYPYTSDPRQEENFVIQERIKALERGLSKKIVSSRIIEEFANDADLLIPGLLNEEILRLNGNNQNTIINSLDEKNTLISVARKENDELINPYFIMITAKETVDTTSGMARKTLNIKIVNKIMLQQEYENSGNVDDTASIILNLDLEIIDNNLAINNIKLDDIKDINGNIILKLTDTGLESEITNLYNNMISSEKYEWLIPENP